MAMCALPTKCRCLRTSSPIKLPSIWAYIPITHHHTGCCGQVLWRQQQCLNGQIQAQNIWEFLFFKVLSITSSDNGWSTKCTWQVLIFFFFMVFVCLSYSQVSATHLKIEHPWMKSSGVHSSYELQTLEFKIGHQDSSSSNGSQGDMPYSLWWHTISYGMSP